LFLGTTTRETKNNVGGMDMQKRCNIPTLYVFPPSISVRAGFGPGNNSDEGNYGDI
jgi:hypothetical protein